MLAACAIGSVAGRVALFLIASRVGHLLIARKCAHLYSSSRINFCIVLDSSPPPRLPYSYIRGAGNIGSGQAAVDVPEAPHHVRPGRPGVQHGGDAQPCSRSRRRGPALGGEALSVRRRPLDHGVLRGGSPVRRGCGWSHRSGGPGRGPKEGFRADKEAGQAPRGAPGEVVQITKMERW